MAGKPLDAETARENKRLALGSPAVSTENLLANTKQKVVKETIASAQRSGNLPLDTFLPPSDYLAERILEKTGPTQVKQTAAKMKNTAWATASPKIQEQTFSLASQVAGGKPLPWSKTYSRYPAIALSVARSLNNGQLSRDQLKTVNAALEIFDTAATLVQANSDITRMNIMASLSQPRQIAVFKAAVGMIDEAKALQAATMTQQGDQSPILQGLGKVFGSVMDTATWLNNQSQHFLRAELQQMQSGKSIIDAWNDTAVGKFDENAVNALRTQYGDDKVNVVQDAVRAMFGDGEFDYTDLLAKYEGNQAALQIIDGILLDDERANIPGLDDLLGRMNAARADNFGGSIANMLLPDSMEGTSPVWTGVSKGTNLASIMLADPTLIVGKAVKGYRAMRWGLMRAFDTNKLEEVFSNRGAVRFFDSLNDDIVRYNESYGADAAKLAGEMRIKYGKYMTDDAIESIANYAKSGGSIKNKKQFVQEWLMDMDGFNKIRNGQAARSIEDVLVPHMSPMQQARIKARLAVRDALTFDGKSDSVLAAVIGADMESVDAQALRAIGIDPKKETASIVAEKLQDPAVQKYLTDRFGMDPVALGARTIKAMTGRYAPAKSVVYRMDKVFRQFELMPRGLQISIDTADDSRKVYQIMRTMFPKSLSEMVADSWKYMDNGERRLAINGIFDSIASARGINLNEVLADGTTLRDKIMVSGSKRAEQYAVTQGVPDDLLFSSPLGQYSQRVYRVIMPKLDAVQADRVNAINARLRGLFEEQKLIRAKLDSVTENIAAKKQLLEDMGGLDAQIQSEVDLLEEEAKLIRTEKGRKWAPINALLNERKLVKQSPAVNYNPAEFAGKQHALHLHQMANSINIPDFALIQRYQQRRGVLEKLIGWTGYSTFTNKAVDVWSFANLISPRYVLRNAAEDWLGYILTGGGLRDAVAGRNMATAFREVRGRKLGFVQEFTRNRADSSSAFGKLFLDHMPKDDVLAFQQAIREGDIATAEGLAGAAVARVQATAGGRALAKIHGASPEEMADFFKVFASTPHSARLVDSVAEVQGDLARGRMTSAEDTSYIPQVRADLRELRRREIFDYSDVSFENNLDTDAYLLWHEQLVNILHNDGRAGQIVFKAMRYADKYKGGSVQSGWERYKDELIDFFSDKEGAASEWWSKSSALNAPGVTVEDFARRYFDDTANYFSHAGNVNGRLIEKLTQTNKETGAKFGGLFNKDASGTILDDTRFTLDDLRQFGRFERPQFVLGKVLKSVAGVDSAGPMDRAFGYASESLARISREPLFFANALREWRGMQPVIKHMVESGISESAAKKIVMEKVMENAEQFTISYIDNPKVRTQLAFNARNVARYYRATEDFYRRALRLASYRPDQLQKLNLVYQNLNNSGFVWEDDMGTQYFIYPGTGVVNQAITKAFQVMGLADPQSVNPFAFGGQTLMLTPSSDPNSMMPTLASPIIAPMAKALTAIGPFAWLEPILLGSRGTAPTTDFGGVLSEIAQSTFPAPFLRLIAAVNRGDRDTMFANATISAMRYAEYAGVYEKRKDESDVAFRARVKEETGNIATGTLIMRFILGFMAPASPQTISTDSLTAEARQMGLKSLRPAYTQLLNKYDGDYDRALAEWWSINPNLMPYTVAATESKGQGYPSTTTDAGKWLITNSDFVNVHPEAAPFLTPDGGDFSFSTYGLAKAIGMITGKSTDRAWLEIATQRDYYSYQETKKSADAAIASAQDATQRNQLRQRWETIKQQMYSANPFLQVRVETMKDQGIKANKELALKDMQLALKDIYANNKGMITDRTERISSMLKTYNSAKADIARYGGTDDYSTEMRKYMRSRLRTILSGISEGDRGATDFYDRVLDPLIG